MRDPMRDRKRVEARPVALERDSKGVDPRPGRRVPVGMFDSNKQAPDDPIGHKTDSGPGQQPRRQERENADEEPNPQQHTR